MHERIRTRRLLIRPFREEDAESFGRNVLGDVSLASFFDGESAPDYIHARMECAEKPRFYDCVILLAESNEAIGEINAAFIPKDTADVGYVIASGFRNRRYASEALSAWIAYLLEEGIRTVYGACRETNAASMTVMKHAGMKPCRKVPANVKARENEEGLTYFCFRG